MRLLRRFIARLISWSGEALLTCSLNLFFDNHDGKAFKECMEELWRVIHILSKHQNRWERMRIWSNNITPTSHLALRLEDLCFLRELMLDTNNNSPFPLVDWGSDSSASLCPKLKMLDANNLPTAQLLRLLTSGSEALEELHLCLHSDDDGSYDDYDDDSDDNNNTTAPPNADLPIILKKHLLILIIRTCTYSITPQIDGLLQRLDCPSIEIVDLAGMTCQTLRSLDTLLHRGPGSIAGALFALELSFASRLDTDDGVDRSCRCVDSRLAALLREMPVLKRLSITFDDSSNVTQTLTHLSLTVESPSSSGLVRPRYLPSLKRLEFKLATAEQEQFARMIRNRWSSSGGSRSFAVELVDCLATDDGVRFPLPVFPSEMGPDGRWGQIESYVAEGLEFSTSYTDDSWLDHSAEF